MSRPGQSLGTSPHQASSPDCSGAGGVGVEPWEPLAGQASTWPFLLSHRRSLMWLSCPRGTLPQQRGRDCSSQRTPGSLSTPESQWLLTIRFICPEDAAQCGFVGRSAPCRHLGLFPPAQSPPHPICIQQRVRENRAAESRTGHSRRDSLWLHGRHGRVHLPAAEFGLRPVTRCGYQGSKSAFILGLASCTHTIT